MAVAVVGDGVIAVRGRVVCQGSAADAVANTVAAERQVGAVAQWRLRPMRVAAGVACGV